MAIRGRSEPVTLVPISSQLVLRCHSVPRDCWRGCCKWTRGGRKTRVELFYLPLTWTPAELDDARPLWVPLMASSFGDCMSSYSTENRLNFLLTSWQVPPPPQHSRSLWGQRRSHCPCLLWSSDRVRQDVAIFQLAHSFSETECGSFSFSALPK